MSGSEDKTIRLWDTETGEARSCVAFSPNGKIIASGSVSIRLWDAESGEAKSNGKAFERDAVAVSALAFSPDGKTIVSGSDNHTISLWDAETGEPKLNGIVLEGYMDLWIK